MPFPLILTKMIISGEIPVLRINNSRTQLRFVIHSMRPLSVECIDERASISTFVVRQPRTCVCFCNPIELSDSIFFSFLSSPLSRCAFQSESERFIFIAFYFHSIRSHEPLGINFVIFTWHNVRAAQIGRNENELKDGTINAPQREHFWHSI